MYFAGLNGEGGDGGDGENGDREDGDREDGEDERDGGDGKGAKGNRGDEGGTDDDEFEEGRDQLMDFDDADNGVRVLVSVSRCFLHHCLSRLPSAMLLPKAKNIGALQLPLPQVLQASSLSKTFLLHNTVLLVWLSQGYVSVSLSRMLGRTTIKRSLRGPVLHKL